MIRWLALRWHGAWYEYWAEVARRQFDATGTVDRAVSAKVAYHSYRRRIVWRGILD